jgi:hypothetical protein
MKIRSRAEVDEKGPFRVARSGVALPPEKSGTRPWQREIGSQR